MLAKHTRSFCGFQSLCVVGSVRTPETSRRRALTSYIMTVSAVSRLIPSPPARVESKNTKSGLPGALKCSIAFLR